MIAVLFARKDSIYKSFPQCDVYDIERDARTFQGGVPVIAHPPCRAWGRLKYFAKPRPDEKDLAFFALQMVRENGGVLEHPERSSFWKAADLPTGRQRDEYGGFTLSVDQHWFGHRARKRTWLYVCGIESADIPAYCPTFNLVQYYVSPPRRANGKRLGIKSISKAEREHTPIKFAEWLIELAEKTTTWTTATST